MAEKQVNPDNPIETMELVEAMIRSYKAGEEIFKDDRFGFNDIPTIIATAPALYKGIIGFKYIDDELELMTDEGKDRLREKIKELVIANDEQLERLVEEYIGWVFKTVQIGKLTQKYLKG